MCDFPPRNVGDGNDGVWCCLTVWWSEREDEDYLVAGGGESAVVSR